MVGVLARFQQEHTVVLANLEGMFDQVHINPMNWDALQMTGDDWNDNPAEYGTFVHLFGVSSSPNCADFGFRHTTDDNQNA